VTCAISYRSHRPNAPVGMMWTTGLWVIFVRRVIAVALEWNGKTVFRW